MWKRCKPPKDLDERKISLAIQSGIDMKFFKGEKFVGFTRGCDAVVVAFKELYVAPKSATPPYPLRPPPGSESSESESSESVLPGPQMADILQTYLTRLQNGEPLSELLEGIQALKQSARVSQPPKVYNWEEAKKVLSKAHWNGGAIEWWVTEQHATELPRFFARTKFILEPEEAGWQALDKAGIIRYNLDVPVEPWAEQPGNVRRFWRGVLGYLSRMNKGMSMPAVEMCGLYEYANHYLPVFWKLNGRKLLYIPDESENLPECDKDYFIRLFDFAITVRRVGVHSIWIPEECLIPAYGYMSQSRNFVGIRYPWVKLPEIPQMLMDMYLDQACEFLWNSTKFIQQSSLPGFNFSLDCLERVLHDAVDACTWSKQLECFTAENFGATDPPSEEDRYTDLSIDSRKAWNRAKTAMHNYHRVPTPNRPLFISTGRSHSLSVKKLQPKKPIPPFMRIELKTKVYEHTLLDLNWVKCHERFSEQKIAFPQWLMKMAMNVPVVPVAVADKVHPLTLYTILIQDDDIWLGQSRWSAKLPLFKVVEDCLYMNSGYAAFSRALLKRKITCILHKPLVI